MEIVLEGILVNSFPPLLYLKWNKRNDKLVNLPIKQKLPFDKGVYGGRIPYGRAKVTATL